MKAHVISISNHSPESRLLDNYSWTGCKFMTRVYWPDVVLDYRFEMPFGRICPSSRLRDDFQGAAAVKLCWITVIIMICE
jgi:hypothetical protein